MSNTSANRSVLIVAVVITGLCLCFCVLTIAGIFILRPKVSEAVATLNPFLANTQQDIQTPTRIIKSTRTPIPTRTLEMTEPPYLTQPPAQPSPTGQQPTVPAEPTAAPQPTLPPEPTTAPTATRLSVSNLPVKISRSMDEIQQQVIELRGLQPSGTFTRDVLTPDQLRENVINDFFEDTTPEDTRNEVLELSLLGLLEPGFDLDTFYTDLFSEQVAGYYDDETKEMYVVGEQFGGVERLTYSHEYVHALQDQNFDLKNGLRYDSDYCEQDSERCAAIQALLEGDASLVEIQWFTQHATTQDYTDIMEFYNTLQMPVYDSAPEFMKEDFVFPYTYGQQFVEALFENGGWDAVDAAYADVPVSTEQILHPERYPDDLPQIVELVDFTSALGDGWLEIDRDVVGEWYTNLILSMGIDSTFRLDTETANNAAEGWGGDAYAAYYSEQTGEGLIVVSYVWDTQKDADEFTSALVRYGQLRFGRPVAKSEGRTEWEYAGGYSIFRQSDQSTWWVIAPNQTTAEVVAAQLEP